MRMDKLTNPLQQAIGDAQSLAVGRDHSMIEPAHLLSAFLNQSGGAITPLLRKAGVNLAAIKSSVATLLLIAARLTPAFRRSGVIAPPD